MIDISEHMPRKLEAIRCYKSQLEYWPYDRAIEGLNAYRGAMLGGFTFAEVFTEVVPFRQRVLHPGDDIPGEPRAVAVKKKCADDEEAGDDEQSADQNFLNPPRVVEDERQRLQKIE